MQVFDINQKPGAVRLIDQLADYVYFLNGSAGGGDTTIVVRPESGGDSVFLKPGQAYKFNDNERAARWSITNLKGEGDIIGQVLFSVGMFTDNRVSGSVEVIDGGKARTYANMAFMATGYQPGLASNFCAVQLYNPAGSGKNLVIEQVSITSANGASGFGISVVKAPLVSAGNFARSKLTGGADSVARIYSGVYPVVQGNSLCGIDAATKNFKFSEPVIVTPEWGIVVTNVTLDATNKADLSASFEFYQDAL